METLAPAEAEAAAASDADPVVPPGDEAGATRGAGEPDAPRARGPVAWFDSLREERGLLIVLGAVAVWCAVMYWLVWLRHENFGTFDNDLGFHDQYVWLLARGKTFSTVLGLPPYGHNATFGYVLLVPFSWLGPGIGPHGLNLFNTVMVGLGAVPLYLLAKDRFGDAFKAVPFGLIWLLHPVVQGNVWETFHPDSIAMAPLMAAYLCATRRRWRPFAVFTLLALIWKSDVSLAVMMLGVVIVLRSWRRSGDTEPAPDGAEAAGARGIRSWPLERTVGLATVAFGFAWFAFTVLWMIPHVSGGGTVFGPLYGDLGETPTDVAATALRDPGLVAGRAWEHEPVRYARDLLAPYGFVSLLGGAPLLMTAWQAIVNVLSDMSFTREWLDNGHYQAIPIVALSLALVEGVAWIGRRRPGWVRPVTAYVVATSLAGTVAWGSLPPFATQAAHFWGQPAPEVVAAKKAAVDLIPPDARVTAHYLLVPHLTHRETVYSFPNPWRRVFYGVRNTPLPDPAGVEYLAVEPAALNSVDADTWNCVLPSFDVIYENMGIVVARRIPGNTDDAACQLD